MSSWLKFTATATLLLGISTPAFALTPEQAKEGERATALVRFVDNVGSVRPHGSAFCIGRNGVFLTAYTVISGAHGGPIELVLRVGEVDQQIFGAGVIHSDQDANFAVLKADSSGPFVPLRGPGADELFAAMPVTAFGYPELHGQVSSRDLPSLIVNPGHVTSLIKQHGEVQRILIDAQIDHGQVGGPVLDDNGRVVAFLAAEGRPIEATTALPLSRLRGENAEPVLVIPPSSLSYENRRRVNQLTFNLLPLKPNAAYTAELQIRSGGSSGRRFSAPVRDGECTFEFVPDMPPADHQPMVTAHFGEASISGRAGAISVRIGGRAVTLDHIRQIDRHGDNDTTVTLDTAEQYSGTLTGAESVAIQLGDDTTTINLAHASHVTVDAGADAVLPVDYTLTARLGDAVVARSTGTITYAGVPTPGGTMTLRDVGQVVDYGRVAPAGSSSTAIQTPFCGGRGGNPMQAVGTVPHDVIGFSYEFAQWDNRGIIRRLLPVYARPLVTSSPRLIMAREGYVVGGILVDSDDMARAFRVIFVKSDGGRIDSTDNYVTEWYGQPSSHLPPKQLAGHGEHVVGVCGRMGLNMDAVGLMVLP